MTNPMAIGYFILAAKALGMDHEQIEIMSDEMLHQMDMNTEGEAEEAHRNI